VATDFQRRKLEKVFASFDPDADGVIDELDLLAMAQVWCDTYGAAPNSADWRGIHAAALAMWRSLRAGLGAPADGKLTTDEWVAAMDSPFFPKFVDDAAIPFSMAVFAAADKDGDGRITAAEMFAGQSRTGMTEAETRAAFEQLDGDGDGFVTAQEYVEAARDFYLSEDPEAAGNLIAGDL